MQSKSAVVVLGMHRSGTSLLCKAIGSLGVDFGDRLIDGDQWNAKGYFEHYDIQQLNDRLLTLLGVRWNTLDIANWEDALPWVYSLKSQAISILQRDFADIPLWGLKDPRMCRLLPFWKGVFNEIGITPQYVLALRNPLNVAMSLHKRDGISVREGAFLWFSHMATALMDSEDALCTVVEYENLLAHPSEQLDRLREALNLSVAVGTSDSRDQFVSSFVDQRLRHNQESINALNAHPDIPDEVKGLYDDMLKMVSFKPLDADWRSMREHCRDLMTSWWPRHVISMSSPVFDARVLTENIALVGRLRCELLNLYAENMAARSQIAIQAALIGGKDAEIMRLRGESSAYEEVIRVKNAEIAGLSEKMYQLKTAYDQYKVESQLEFDSLSSNVARVKEDLEGKIRLIRRYELLIKMSGIRPDV